MSIGWTSIRDWWSLESGLNEGQKVIVKGVQLVRPGQTVETEEADLEKFNQA